jgi:hypothetical protein
MRTALRHTAALLLGGILAAPAPAQQGPALAPNQAQPPSTTTVTTNVVAPPAYAAPPVVNPYGYGYGYPTTPYAQYAEGRSQLITAKSQAALTDQQAALVQQQVYNAQLDTRRAVWNESVYERGNLMNSEQVRLKNQLDALNRARNNPPQNEIWSGDSLNAIFTDIKNADTYGVRGPAVPLDQAMLKHINLTTGETAGNIGLLKAGPKLTWPVVLQDDQFKAQRGGIDVMLATAFDQAAKGPVDPKLIRNMSDANDRMGVILKQMVKDLSPSDYIDGKRYLRDLDDSIRSLSNPNVANYINGNWSAKGATVYDLSKHMIKNGLKFAAATPGDQPYYTAFYQALLSYDMQMTQAASASR